MNAPILTRTLLFQRLRDGSIDLLDFHLVNTTLGAMVEPRTLIAASGAMQNEDIYDSAYTDIREVDVNTFNNVGFAGTQWPRKFNSL